MISTKWWFTFCLFGFFMIGVTGTALLIAAAVVVAIRERRQTVPRPDVPVAASLAEVRVKAVERKTGPVAEGELAAASGAVAIVCGEDAVTADRYEARNDALRSIAPYRMAASAGCWSGRHAKRLCHSQGLRSIRSRRTSARRASRKGS